MLHGTCVGEEAAARNIVLFRAKGQLVCEAGAGWVRPRLGVVRTVMAASMCFACLHIAVTWCFGIFGYKTHCNIIVLAAWDLCWGGSQSAKHIVFPASSRHRVRMRPRGWKDLSDPILWGGTL